MVRLLYIDLKEIYSIYLYNYYLILGLPKKCVRFIRETTGRKFYESNNSWKSTKWSFYPNVGILVITFAISPMYRYMKTRLVDLLRDSYIF